MTIPANAALYFHPDAYDTGRSRLLGRHSAGESFLRGFLRHAQVEKFVLWNVAGKPLEHLGALVERIAKPTRPVRWIAPRDRLALEQVGVLNIPHPDLGAEVWLRGPFGSHRYATCGITHTTATEKVMEIVGDLLVAPTEGHDALICTSSAVRQSIETQLDGVRDYLERERGPRRRAEPMRATIPLGVNADDFAISAGHRADWRARLNIPSDAIVALYVGRFNRRAKMNPALMALALEHAAQRLDQPLYWVTSGWAESATEEAEFHATTQTVCPSVRYIPVDGRPPHVRFSIWSVADIFISFSDNIQETFGLTPVEAMAAGLPSVVSDWDGYKDTVRDGVDGFRIATIAPNAGQGGDLAYAFANGWLNYDNYVGAAAQYTAVDVPAAARAIVELASNPDLRGRMGAAAKIQARDVFDWKAIIPQYQALWAEQDARRRAGLTSSQVLSDNPFRPDPYRLFASYPTHLLTDEFLVAVTPLPWAEARARLISPAANYSAVGMPSIDEMATLVAQVVASGPCRVGDLRLSADQARWPFLKRSLLWLARYNVITIAPPT